jgi:predicted metal-dependent hydrolase
MPFSKRFEPEPEMISRACTRPLHPDAERGIQLYNQGKYFVAHEALEDAWHAEEEPDRRLYQGILQAGIAFMHARNASAKGVRSMYERCSVWLKPWPDHCRTLDVGQLREDVEALMAAVTLLEPDRLDELDPALFTPIKRVQT